NHQRYASIGYRWVGARGSNCADNRNCPKGKLKHVPTPVTRGNSAYCSVCGAMKSVSPVASGGAGRLNSCSHYLRFSSMPVMDSPSYAQCRTHSQADQRINSERCCSSIDIQAECNPTRIAKLGLFLERMKPRRLHVAETALEPEIPVEGGATYHFHRLLD